MVSGEWRVVDSGWWMWIVKSAYSLASSSIIQHSSFCILHLSFILYPSSFILHPSPSVYVRRGVDGPPVFFMARCS